MKTKLWILFSIFSHALAFGQQWSGSTTISGAISRVGYVTIGDFKSSNSLTIQAASAAGGWPGGWGVSSHLDLTTSYPNTKLSIGSTSEGNFYIGRTGSTQPQVDLRMDIRHLGVDGQVNIKGNALIGGHGGIFNNPYKLNVLSPDYKTAHFKNSTGSTMLALENSTNDTWGITASGTGNGLNIPSGSFYIEKVGLGAKLVIDNAGKIGINIAVPQEQLHVVGNVKIVGKLAAMEICANTTSSWCDYVFEPTYDLPKLKQVQDFIQKNKHLPGIPSEKDVKANGYNLTSMDAALLKKLEEAYLYILDLEARLKKVEEKTK